jgi:hypothetical protein
MGSQLAKEQEQLKNLNCNLESIFDQLLFNSQREGVAETL